MMVLAIFESQARKLFGVGTPRTNDSTKIYVQILWGLALYFLIPCIGTERKKVRQDVTDYKLKLEISEGVLLNFEFLIFIWNFEFWLRISNFDFELWILILNLELRCWISNFDFEFWNLR